MFCGVFDGLINRDMAYRLFYAVVLCGGERRQSRIAHSPVCRLLVIYELLLIQVRQTDKLLQVISLVAKYG